MADLKRGAAHNNQIAHEAYSMKLNSVSTKNHPLDHPSRLIFRPVFVRLH